MNLQDKVSSIRGVGEKKSKLLHNMKIDTVEDLLHLFPRKYEDRRNISYIMEAPFDKDVLIKGKVTVRQMRGNPYNKRTPLRILVQDESADLEVLFFNGRYLTNYFNIGSEYTFFGKIVLNNGRRQMAHPEFHKLGDKEDMRGIFPIYPLTEGLTQANMRKLQQEAASCIDQAVEWLPEDIVKRYNLCSPAYALKNVHFPDDERNIKEARYRMIFEELLILQTGLLYIKKGSRQRKSGTVVERDISVREFTDRLPFQLTSGQLKVWEEIQSDMASDRPMNRLVQGDVGSGKTMVAAAAAYCAARNGRQTALMAPTEILAEQHFASLSALFAPLGVSAALLTGSMTGKQKKDVRERIAAGEVQVVIGTHALLSESTRFDNLGLVITDEQHRFGVGQRSRLSAKGEDPHLLVMSATPIPRTLALILYGDLDVSVLDELPPGREPVDTFLVGESYRPRINAFIRKQVSEGHQCFVVCPAVEENEELGIKAASVWADTLQQTVFPDLRIALLHGQMKGAEKEAAMASFARGEADVMVATTVIEVGVDVKNATVMVIENADRFGLAQLH